ncbi:MAG TPA: hypothetical protein VFZ09_46295 [Archangium sp.]|uniref:hypothetical protein n=1 Tax=Archangium sp. TaxID=1872627 RepID=UPI002E3420C2|nr:hypothetical protein [Archangium sp.]HEX5753689.1 hypothetical protein [Archangium sp.]
MRETIEIRISSDKAQHFLPPGVGEDWDITRRLELDVDDPLVEAIRKHEQEEHRQGTTMVTFWQVRRRYSQRELQSAELLWMRVRPFFEPTGEECGTRYDESQACATCGSGARQVSELRLDLKRIPKGRDIAQTLGGELVVSSRLAEALRAHGITGMELRPVLGKQGERSKAWRQLVIPSCSLEVAAPTRVGNSFFAPEPDTARCPKGHVLGLRVLSEVYVSRSSLDGNDWACTRQRVGLRQGLFRTQPLILISQRLYRLLSEMKVRRFDVEVAWLSPIALAVRRSAERK